MVIKNHNGYVSYTNYAKEIAEARHRSLYDSLNLSFDRLKLLDVALDDVRYSEFDFQSKNATYRSYINGFPIISADEYGSYQVQITDSWKSTSGFLALYLASAGSGRFKRSSAAEYG